MKYEVFDIDKGLLHEQIIIKASSPIDCARKYFHDILNMEGTVKRYSKGRIVVTSNNKKYVYGIFNGKVNNGKDI